MRRMFQGRMISVDGCGKRMQANWNEFAINKDNDRGVRLLQKQATMPEGEQPVILDSDTRNIASFTVKPGATYKITTLKPGFDIFVGEISADNIVLVRNSWLPNQQTITINADTAFIIISMSITGNHEAPITVGDCGITIEEVR